MKVIDLTGQTFGHLKVLRYMGLEKHGSATWECSCDCGKTCVVKSPYLKGLTGCNHPSCGCKAWEGNRKANKRDRNATYKCWTGITERCTNPNSVGYQYYGGRGIKLCEEWRSYDNFLRDMGDKPAGMQIDRINNDGDYEKANCRWTTPTGQSRNRRTNVMLTINGETLCAAEWEERAGFRQGVIRDRIRQGWPTERLLEPLKYNFKRGKPPLPA